MSPTIQLGKISLKLVEVEGHSPYYEGEWGQIKVRISQQPKKDWVGHLTMTGVLIMTSALADPEQVSTAMFRQLRMLRIELTSFMGSTEKSERLNGPI